MKAKQLHNLGVPRGKVTKLVQRMIDPARSAGLSKDDIRSLIKSVVDAPASHVDDPYFGDFARLLLPECHEDSPFKPYIPRDEPAPWRQWGEDLDENSIQQMRNACELPVAVQGALMPDAHLGYGLPIGGVLATEGAVIPYAVGVDIACRMKLTVLDMPLKALDGQRDRLIGAIEAETRFGVGAQFKGKKREHDVMDEDWSITPMIRRLKDKAHAQLGTSGSGNHFVEFGQFTVSDEHAAALGMREGGAYLALLSHSGSRGCGASIASHYSSLAMKRQAHLPKHLKHLAWLELDREEGQEYWAAMELMGRYAHANHDCIHRAVVRYLGARAVASIENHHNFAWKEMHGGREVVVHRKGATPAGEGALGVIPGSMANPAYVVRGKGEPQSLHSASHGAGRVMSRTQAKKTYRWPQVRDYLKHRGVELLSAGLDEVPFVYKNIDEVMAAQADLVEALGRFDPRLVKMAPAGERPED